MPDDLTNKGPQDRSRISLLEPHEVQYWADKFNVSKERLSEAVKNVGHSAAAVEKELKKLAWEQIPGTPHHRPGAHEPTSIVGSPSAQCRGCSCALGGTPTARERR